MEENHKIKRLKKPECPTCNKELIFQDETSHYICVNYDCEDMRFFLLKGMKGMKYLPVEVVV